MFSLFSSPADCERCNNAINMPINMRMKTKSTSVVYTEHFYPWFLPLTFFLPCFWKYGVVIKRKPESITFGYGVFGPTEKSLCSHTTYYRNVEKSSIRQDMQLEKTINFSLEVGALGIMEHGCTMPHFEVTMLNL